MGTGTRSAEAAGLPLSAYAVSTVVSYFTNVQRPSGQQQREAKDIILRGRTERIDFLRNGEGHARRAVKVRKLWSCSCGNAVEIFQFASA